MSRRRTLLPLLLLAATLACVGPQPLVEQQQTMAPARPGEPYTVIARLRNEGPGEGQVDVEVRLVAADGTTYRQSRKVDLEAHERTIVTVRIPAPAGHYVTQVNARYPPR